MPMSTVKVDLKNILKKEADMRALPKVYFQRKPKVLYSKCSQISELYPGIMIQILYLVSCPGMERYLATSIQLSKFCTGG